MAARIDDHFVTAEHEAGRHRHRAVQLACGGLRPRRLDRACPPSRLFTRNQAITAIVLAERLAAGYGD
jgi:hypothetical protein